MYAVKILMYNRGTFASEDDIGISEHFFFLNEKCFRFEKFMCQETCHIAIFQSS